MKKILFVTFVTVCLYSLFPQENNKALSNQKTGFPYPFSTLVSTAIPLIATSEHAYTGIIVPESFLPKFEAVLTKFQATEYPVILFFSKTTDSTLVDFIHAYYPQLQFLLIVNFSNDNTILFDKITMTKTSLLLISFFNQKGEKTQFKLLDSFFYTRNASNFGLETLNLVLPESYALDYELWNSFFLLFKRNTLTVSRVYLVPILVWLVPIQAEHLYIMISFLFLINLLVYRIRSHSSLEFWMFVLTIVLTLVMLWYSLVITSYLLTVLLLKQIAGKSMLRNSIVLYPLVFWGMVVLHDKLLYSIPAESLRHVVVSGFVFIGSILIALIPPSTQKLKHIQDSNR